MPSTIRGRFAPSPSGRMHLGNIFSAVLSWLFVRTEGGTLVLRVEDLDPQRCRREYADQLYEDLMWLGLDYEEGAYRGGPHASYFQSKRGDFYRRALEQLDNQGLLYPCFCTRAELHVAEAPHRSDGTLIYPGTCACLSQKEAAQRALTISPALRLRVPSETIGFLDGCCGWYEEQLALECGDFILCRKDGVAAYQLAVVVDDAAMDITQVVRGRDLLSSTPRQLLLYRLLGLKPPVFFHIPLLLSPSGRRLSKRDGDLDIGCLRKYFRPEDLFGRIAFLLGWISHIEPITLSELSTLFSVDSIPKNDIFVPFDLFCQ